MAALKVKEFPGLQRIAPETIEKHDLEQQLRAANTRSTSSSMTCGQSFCSARASCAKNTSTVWLRSRRESETASE